MPNDPSSRPTQPLTDEGPASERDKADMVAARREIQAVLDGRLPMDNAAYSAAIVMVLWKAGWRPRHLSTSMDRCDIADGWWRLGLGWRQRFQETRDELDRLKAKRAEFVEVHEPVVDEMGVKRCGSCHNNLGEMKWWPCDSARALGLDQDGRGQ